MNRTLSAALMLATLSGSASAQCNYFRYGVPDFDQRRSTLASNGNNYCVPTSLVNWMGYLANHGLPNAMGHSSSNWASAAEYATVTSRINSMGIYCDTDPDGGTVLSNSVEGVVDYMNARNIGYPFFVFGYVADDEWTPRPSFMAAWIKMHSFVNMLYGHWEWNGSSWDRNGGHSTSLVGVYNLCGNAPRVGFSDPWTSGSDSNTTQSAFAVKYWDLERLYGDYAGNSMFRWGIKTDDPNKRKILDKLLVIMPMIALTNDPVRNYVITYTPSIFNTIEESQSPTHINSPTGGKILGALLHPAEAKHIIAVGAKGVTPAGLWSFDPVDETEVKLVDLPWEPRTIKNDRLGNILVLGDGSVRKYRLMGDGSVRLLQDLVTRTAFDAMGVDSANDDIYLLDVAGRKLKRYGGGDLLGTPYDGTLATNIMPTGTPTIDVSSVQHKPFITWTGGTQILRLAPAMTAAFWSIDVSINVGPNPKNLHVLDGDRLAYSTNGILRELEIDPASGRYIPAINKVLDGSPVGDFFMMPRSQTNFDPAIHSLPAWVDNPGTDDTSPEYPLCVADFNVDTYVNGDDYDLFASEFDAAHHVADLNFDGFVNGDDYDLFASHFEEGC